jgi:cytochrome c oxidase subunit 3
MDLVIPRRTQRTSETLLVAFLATVVMLFAGFTSALLIRRTGSDWAPLDLPPLALANTLVLIVSSATLELARRARVPGWTTVTLFLGVAFLGGQIGLVRALADGGAFVASRPEGAFLFLLALVHGAHLLGGLVALGVVALRRQTPRLAAVYWHFLGLAWLYVLLLLDLR